MTTTVSHFDLGKVGRSSTKIELNLNNPLQALPQLQIHLHNNSLRENLKTFVRAVDELIRSVEDKSKQTDGETQDIICQYLSRVSKDEYLYILYSIVDSMNRIDRVKLLMMIYNEIDIDEQADLLAFQGDSLNNGV